MGWLSRETKGGSGEEKAGDQEGRPASERGDGEVRDSWFEDEVGRYILRLGIVPFRWYLTLMQPLLTCGARSGRRINNNVPTATRLKRRTSKHRNSNEHDELTTRL